MACAERNELPRSAQNRGSSSISRAERNPPHSAIDQSTIGNPTNESHCKAVKNIRHADALFLKLEMRMHIRHRLRAIVPIHATGAPHRAIVHRADLQLPCAAPTWALGAPHRAIIPPGPLRALMDRGRAEPRRSSRAGIARALFPRKFKFRKGCLGSSVETVSVGTVSGGTRAVSYAPDPAGDPLRAGHEASAGHRPAQRSPELGLEHARRGRAHTCSNKRTAHR